MTDNGFDFNRNAVIARIKAALKARSGKPWSVTGGKGTAYGWITINAPPKRRTYHTTRRKGSFTNWPEDFEDTNTGQPGGHISPEERRELADLLGLVHPVHFQGTHIMASHDAYREYVDRAEGRTPSKIAEPYWD